MLIIMYVQRSMLGTISMQAMTLSMNLQLTWVTSPCGPSNAESSAILHSSGATQCSRARVGSCASIAHAASRTTASLPESHPPTQFQKAQLTDADNTQTRAGHESRARCGCERDAQREGTHLSRTFSIRQRAICPSSGLPAPTATVARVTAAALRTYRRNPHQACPENGTQQACSIYQCHCSTWARDDKELCWVAPAAMGLRRGKL